MKDERHVDLEVLRDLMRKRDEVCDLIDKQIQQFPAMHCQTCGDTQPKHGFAPIMGGCYGGSQNYDTTSGVWCNKCHMSDEEYEKAFAETKAGKQLLQWGSWDGKVQVFKYIDHQHMSNIHYYINIIHPEYYSKDLKEMVRETLMETHGRILPYRPCPDFAYEKIQLTAKGLLDRHGDVKLHGHKIGGYVES